MVWRLGTANPLPLRGVMFISGPGMTFALMDARAAAKYPVQIGASGQDSLLSFDLNEGIATADLQAARALLDELPP
jgi:hypothetical protein